MDEPSANVEIKARVNNRALLVATIERELPGIDPLLVVQRDTFFACSTGRLKLREFVTNQERPSLEGELIWYSRADTQQSKVSTFHKADLHDGAAQLGVVLGKAYASTGVVSKTRLVYWHDRYRTRIHVDSVEGLGEFVELEVRVSETQGVDEAKRIAALLCLQLGIDEADFVAGAYVDELARAK